MSGTVIDDLIVRIRAEAGSYSKDLQKIVADTKAAMGQVQAAVQKATDPAKNADVRFQARVKAANRIAAEEIKQAERVSSHHAAVVRKSYALEQKMAYDAAQSASKQKEILQKNHDRIVRNSYALEQKEADKLYSKKLADFEKLAAHTDRIRSNSAKLEQKLNLETIQAAKAAKEKATADRREFGGTLASKTPGALRGLSRGVNRVGTALSASITAPVLAAGAAGVSSFAQFDDAITRAVAVAGGASDAMRGKMVANAKQIASSGIISSTDLARAYKNLAQAGLSLQDSLHGLKIVQQFATAGEMDMEHATEMLIRSQTTLGRRSEDPIKNAKEMERVSDLFVKAANMSTAKVEDFARATITKSGAMARVLKVPMEELIAVQVVMADAGVKAELAGEQIAIVMRDTQAAMLRHAAAWEKIGISVYDTHGKYVGIVSAIRQLEKVTEGMTDKERKQLLSNKALGFQERSILATYTLLGRGKKMEAALEELNKLGTESRRLASLIESSFLSQLKILYNQLVVISQEIGQVLAPYIIMLNGYVAKAAKWWGGLSDSTKRMIVMFVLAAATLGPLVLFVGMFIGSLALAASGIAAFVALGPEAVAAIGGIGAVALAAGGFLAYLATTVVRALQKMNDPEGYKKFNEQITSMFRIAQELFGAFSSWIYEHAVPVLKEAGRIAGDEMGKAFIAAFKAAMSGPSANVEIPITEKISSLESHIVARKKAGAPKEEIQSLQGTLSGMKKENTGSNIFKTFGNILEREGVKFGAPSFANQSAVPFGSNPFGVAASARMSAGRGGGAAKPDVVKGDSGMFAEMHAEAEKFIAGLTDSAIALKREEESAEKQIKKLTESLREQVATEGMNHRQVTIWRLEQKMLRDGLAETEKADLALWRAKSKELDALEAEAKAAKKASTELEHLKNQAERITEKHMTPASRLKKERKELEDMLKLGLLDRKEVDAELKELDEKLRKDHKVNVSLHLLDAQSAEQAVANHIFSGMVRGRKAAEPAKEKTPEELVFDRTAKIAGFSSGEAAKAAMEKESARRARIGKFGTGPRGNPLNVAPPTSAALFPGMSSPVLPPGIMAPPEPLTEAAKSSKVEEALNRNIAALDRNTEATKKSETVTLEAAGLS